VTPGQPVRIDLGCGANKKTGFLGLDFVDAPGVDHVLDLTKDRYPFDDASVDEVFSAHFLEHIEAPNNVFSEIGRIAKDGARIEFWTPYAFSDEASLYGHLHYLTEEEWLHFGVLHRDAHVQMLGGRWLLHRINFVVGGDTVAELAANGVAVDFAIKYFKGVVVEFGVEIEFERDLDTPAVTPVRAWSTSRYGERNPFPTASTPQTSTPQAPTTNGQTGTLRRVARKLPAPMRAKIRAILR
jgi:SAM-dependent methyltransferase